MTLSAIHNGNADLWPPISVVCDIGGDMTLSAIHNFSIDFFA